MPPLSVVSDMSPADQTQLFNGWISSFVSSDHNYGTSVKNGTGKPRGASWLQQQGNEKMANRTVLPRLVW